MRSRPGVLHTLLAAELRLWQEGVGGRLWFSGKRRVGPTTDCARVSKTRRDWKFPGEARDVRTWRRREGDTTWPGGGLGGVCVFVHTGRTHVFAGQWHRVDIFTNKMPKKHVSAAESVPTVAANKRCLDSCSNTKNHFPGVKRGQMRFSLGLFSRKQTGFSLSSISLCSGMRVPHRIENHTASQKHRADGRALDGHLL